MKIVCFGDSVTRGISYVKGRLRIVKENYPTILQQALGSVADVVNRGVFNDNSDLLKQRVRTDVLDERPDYVVIGIGGNDCNFDWQDVSVHPDDTHQSIVPLSRYLDNVVAVTKQVREVGAMPIILNLAPLDPVRYYNLLSSQFGPAIAHWIARCGGIEHWHARYNAALQQMMTSLNETWIDIRSAFLHSDNLDNLISDDGIHPTPQGYQLMSQIVGDYMRSEILGRGLAGAK